MDFIDVFADICFFGLIITIFALNLLIEKTP
jgi:hypothetical protein